MDNEIKRLLKRVMPQLIKNPKIMEGFDLVSNEIDYILEYNKIPFEWLKEVAWDNFFECSYKKIRITYNEALQLRHFLIYDAIKEIKKLKELFPFLV